MPTTIAVTEDAAGGVVASSGSVSGGRVVGIAVAGRSTGGLGTAVTGTYGALTMNADGSFSYRLDGADRDTRLIGAGETAYDRFTYTYEAGGETRTETVTVAIAGVDQPGIAVTRATSAMVLTESATIAEGTRLVREGAAYPPAAVSLGDKFTGAPIVLTNAGAILATTADGYLLGVSTGTFLSAVVNEGRIAVVTSGGTGGSTGISGSIQTPPLAQPVINRGVVQVDSAARAQFSPLVNGIEARTVDNSGTVYVTAAAGLASGIGSRPAPVTVLNNSGTVFASSGDTAGFVGFAAFGVQAYGSNIAIANSGIIAAQATAPGLRSVGISVFVNSSNPLAGGSIVNTGRIVADVAFWAIEGYYNTIGFTNAGFVQGDWLTDKNVMMVVNAANATWLGAFSMGYDPDLVRNDGVITGLVNLGGGTDLYDGSRGASGTRVFGGAGNDVLRGGAGADLLDGADGNDAIFGDAGDLLTGGAGADRFVLAGAATVTDFESGRDVLDLSAMLPSGYAVAATGSDTRVTVGTAAGDVVVTVRGTIATADIVIAAAGALQTGTAAGDVLVAPTIGSAQLSGAGGNDVLVGGNGNDTLDGGAGDDAMFGGEGDDTYIIDSFGDRAIETADGGIDEILVSTDYLLAPFIENARLLGSAGIGIGGNDLDNVIRGNDGANEIGGGGGADLLYGGLGADRLTGGPGADRFLYLSAAESTANGFDWLVGFESGIDTIDLTAVGIRGIAFEPFYNYWAGPFGNYTTATITTASGVTMVIRADGRLENGDFIGFQTALPREVIRALPGDGAVAVPVIADLRFVLSGAVARGAGAITLAKADGTIVETFDAASPRLTLAGPVLTIDPTRVLEAGTAYVLAIADGALTVGGAPFAGLVGYEFTTGMVATAPGYQLLAGDAVAATVSGSGTVFGVRGTLQDVTVLDTPGRITFDASFNAGGDRVRLAHAAGDYTVSRAGSTMFLNDGDSIVALPIGPATLDVQFADGIRTLQLDTAAGVARLGGQLLTGSVVPVTAAPGAATVAGSASSTAGTLMVMVEGGSGTAHGTATVLGTRGGKENVTVAPGAVVTFDPSFNAGGDIITLSGKASAYTAVRSGSGIVLTSGGERVTIPVGPAYSTIRFDDGERTLAFNQGTQAITLEAQTIGTTAVAVAPTAGSTVLLGGMQTAFNGNVRFLHEGEATVGGAIQSFSRGDSVQLSSSVDRYIFAGNGADVTISYLRADGTLATTTIVGIADPAVYIDDLASAQAAAGYHFATFGP